MNDITIPYTLAPLDVNPWQVLRFIVEGKEVGCFDFGKHPITFNGDVDASAKIFVDNVIKMFPGRDLNFSDRQVREWMGRNGFQGTIESGRLAMQDAATLQ